MWISTAFRISWGVCGPVRARTRKAPPSNTTRHGWKTPRDSLWNQLCRLDRARFTRRPSRRHQGSSRRYLARHFMDYDLGHFDLETRVLEPLENPFGPKVLPM